MKLLRLPPVMLALGLVGVLAVACEGDPPRHAAYAGDAGAGGVAGAQVDVAAGRSSVIPAQGGIGATEAGAPNTPELGGSPAGGSATLEAGGGPGVNPNGGAPSVTPEGGASVAGAPVAAAGAPVAVAGAPAGGAPVVGACDGELYFPDQNFESSVLAALDKSSGPITAADVAGLTSFTLQSVDGDIDITGIECLTALQTINFANNAVGTPLSALANLPNLRSLDLSHDYLSDDALTDLPLLTQLTSLNLSDNDLYSIDMLSTLVNLKTLNLDRANGYLFHAYDLTALDDMTQLEQLDVSRTVITDLTPLASHTKLKSLSLAYVTSTDITPLSQLTALQTLNIGSTGTTSLAALVPLIALTTLDISSNQISDLSVPAALPAIKQLVISYNPIASLAPLIYSAYFTTGVSLWAEGLNCTTFGADLLTLAGKGVGVQSSC